VLLAATINGLAVCVLLIRDSNSASLKVHFIRIITFWLQYGFSLNFSPGQENFITYPEININFEL